MTKLSVKRIVLVIGELGYAFKMGGVATRPGAMREGGFLVSFYLLYRAEWEGKEFAIKKMRNHFRETCLKGNWVIGGKWKAGQRYKRKIP